jgi:hypothetical protein
MQCLHNQLEAKQGRVAVLHRPAPAVLLNLH